MNRFSRSGSPLNAIGRLFLLILSSLALSCGGSRPISDPADLSATAHGYRALFKGQSVGPEGKQRFRMAAVLVPPDRLRLEFFGPVGGAHLVVAASGGESIVLSPRERAWDRGPASAVGMERLIGVPLAPFDLVALLTGRPMCTETEASQTVRTRPAATFGRVHTWFDVSCPPGEIRYLARCRERGGLLETATVREGISGAMILEVEYGDHVEGSGQRWPKEIEIRVARRNTTVSLRAVDGPWAGPIQDSLFAPPVPEQFERRPLIASLTAPGLLGSTADGE